MTRPDFANLTGDLSIAATALPRPLCGFFSAESGRCRVAPRAVSWMHFLTHVISVKAEESFAGSVMSALSITGQFRLTTLKAETVSSLSTIKRHLGVATNWQANTPIPDLESYIVFLLFSGTLTRERTTSPIAIYRELRKDECFTNPRDICSCADGQSGAAGLPVDRSLPRSPHPICRIIFLTP